MPAGPECQQCSPVVWVCAEACCARVLACVSGRSVSIADRALVQKIACVYWVGHYAKRIGETYLVHT